MRRFASSLLVASALLSFAACKEDPHRPPPAGELPQAPPLSGGAGGGASGEGGVDAGESADGGDAGACNDLSNEGVVVDQNGVVGDAPTGTGGTIQDGTYELTLASIYVGAAGTPGPTGQQVQGALRITGNQFVRAHRQGATGGTPQEQRTSGTLVTNGSTLTLTTSCPFVSQDQTTYSVVSNTLVVTSLVTRESWTYTLR